MPSVNWKALKEEFPDESGKILDAGTVETFQVIGAKHSEAANGKDMFNLQLVVVGGPNAKTRVWHRIVLSPESKGAMNAFWSQMKGLSIPSNLSFWDQNPSHEDVCAAMKGKQFSAKVKVTEWQGTERNELEGFSFKAVASDAPAAPPAPAAAAPPPPPPAPAAPAPAPEAAPPNLTSVPQPPAAPF